MVNPATIVRGPALIGLFFNILLFGVMLTQTSLYFYTYRKDRTWIKAYVAVLFLADAMNSIFDCIWMYQCMVIHFGDVSYIFEANWVFSTGPALTGIIAALVQLFFGWRIKVLIHSWPLVILIIICASAGALGGIGTAIAIKIAPPFLEFQKTKVVTMIWLVSNAVGDVTITSALTWYLRQHKTGLPATDNTINKIIRLTLQTGMLTAIVAILDICFFLGSSSGLTVHLAFNFPLSKLYTNSLMSSLNSRSYWKYQTCDPSHEEGRISCACAKEQWQCKHGVGVGVVDLSTGPGSEAEVHQMVEIDDKSVSSFYPTLEDLSVPCPCHHGQSPTSPTFDHRMLQPSPTSPTFNRRMLQPGSRFSN